MKTGQVIGIFISPQKGLPMQALEKAEAIAGKGLKGDRYFGQEGTIKKGIRHVTLIEEEALAAVWRDYSLEFFPIETRRNLLTRNVSLNHLVGKAFQVGDVILRGIELSEPCGYLEKLSGKKIREALIHRGGLRAEIVASGEIKIGMPVLEILP